MAPWLPVMLFCVASPALAGLHEHARDILNECRRTAEAERQKRLTRFAQAAEIARGHMEEAARLRDKHEAAVAAAAAKAQAEAEAAKRAQAHTAPAGAASDSQQVCLQVAGLQATRACA
jgi:hypothetical protein